MFHADVNNHLKPVLDELIDVYHVWEELGLVLGIKPGKLTQIGNENRKDNKRMWATIEVWLKRGKANWQGLITALSDPQVDEDVVAKAIKSKITLKALSDTT